MKREPRREVKRSEPRDNPGRFAHGRCENGTKPPRGLRTCATGLSSLAPFGGFVPCSARPFTAGAAQRLPSPAFSCRLGVRALPRAACYGLNEEDRTLRVPIVEGSYLPRRPRRSSASALWRWVR